MNEIITNYFKAWNEQDPAERHRRLEQSLTDDVELVHPSGRFHGITAIDEQIDRYLTAMPGTEVAIASGIDTHNHLARYAWKILNPLGDTVMEGIDVVEQVADGRLNRILMFHGPLPPAN